MCPASMYLVAAALLAGPPDTPMAEVGDLASLLPGRTAAHNSLWIENPLSDQFRSSKRGVVADIKGPATITMIHFAMPGRSVQTQRDRGSAVEDLLGRGEARPASIVRWSISSATRRACGARSIRRW